MQRTRISTEAYFLLMDYAFGLGYRRVEWKCDSLNKPSRDAAMRLGMSFDGVFRHDMFYKGRCVRVSACMWELARASACVCAYHDACCVLWTCTCVLVGASAAEPPTRTQYGPQQGTIDKILPRSSGHGLHIHGFF